MAELKRTQSNAHLLHDGRVQLSLDFQKVQEHFHLAKQRTEINRKQSRITFGTRVQDYERLQPLEGVPRMNVCILITGSRGDVQPFIALGRKLQAPPYNHRVRIGTHPNFREFVRENGLDFFSIGGDPERLMAYMVRNPGILPSLESVRAGDVGARKAELEEMLMGAWKACTESCDDHDIASGVDTSKLRPFVADAIISNPPTYASLHIAERLAIPLHYMFTMPWSPTTAFPHPLAQMDSSRTDAGRRNFISYTQIELLTWLGLADIINRFRRRTLLLEPVDPTWGLNLLSRLKVPYTYCWSPALIPKPADWGPHIDVSGFFFLPKASTYEPDPKLKAFLDAGEPPIYIGFGSIVVGNPEAFTKLILEAVEKAGVRALVSKGWSNVGGNHVPDNVYLLGNVPHDWLFQHVSAVVHHGGAGTCAIGLALGRPTVIVPFFGDQFWWAGIVARAGAGPQAVPYKELTADKLADNIKKALEPGVLAKAHEMSERMKSEDGVTEAAEQFQKNIPTGPTGSTSCFICPDRVAEWRVRRTNIQVSSLVCAFLVKNHILEPKNFKLIRHKRWYVEEGAPGPIFGGVAAAADFFANCAIDIQDYHRSTAHLKKSKNHTEDIEKNEKEDPYCVKKDRPSKGQAIGRLTKELAAEIAIGPINFLYQVANGFHNMPSTVMHDRTVRVRDPILDIKSGIKVASKEVIFGLYDSVTGIASQPYHGYQEGKTRKGGPAWGAVKGTGRGFFGVYFRLGAIAFGIPGYSWKGVEMQFRHSGTTLDQVRELPPAFIDPPAEKRYTEEYKRWLREKWGRFSAGHPILQRRIWQSLSDMHEVEAKNPELEAVVLERWEALVRDCPLPKSG